MSGDVQPRKRKDKRRKRDDDESSHGVHSTKMGSDDVHLHVQHDHGTGGHWCAKIIFFSLMTILLGLVALIIMENRGLADLDTPLSESRFSNYFDGWVEEHRDEHGDGAHAASEEPFEEEDEDENHSELEEAEADDAEADELNEHDEEEADDDHDDGEQENATAEQTAEADEDDEDDNDNDIDNNDDDDDDNIDNDDNLTVEQTVEANDDDVDDDDFDDEDAVGNDINDDDDGDNDNDNDDNEEEQNNNGGEVDDDDDDGNDDDIDLENEADNTRASNNANNANDDDNDDDDGANNVNDDDGKFAKYAPARPRASLAHHNVEDNDDDDIFDEDDDDEDDTFENIVENDAEELLILQQKAAAASNDQDNDDDDDNDGNDNINTESSWVTSLAVKIGVGVALALVARLVLIRKNPNSIEEPTPEVLMKRRLTIASAEEQIPDDDEEPPLLDDDYSEEEVEIEEEIEIEDDYDMDVDENNDVIAVSGNYVPETFEQLQSMYKSMDSKDATVKETNESVRKSPAVFNAPPPPPLLEAPTDVAMKTSAATSAAVGATTVATTITAAATAAAATKGHRVDALGISGKANEQKAEVDTASLSRKRRVTHDVDHDEHDDDDDIDYDEDDADEDEPDDASTDESYDLDDLDEGDISDVDDTELMNRLEAKYGSLPAKEYESDQDPDDPTWTRIKPKESLDGGSQAAVEFDDDDQNAADKDAFAFFEQELRRANEHMMEERFPAALQAFNQLTRKYSHQPAAFLAQAKALDHIAQLRQSNQLLGEALEAYKRYLAFAGANTNDNEYRVAADRCIERMRFMGYYMQAVHIHEQLIERFSGEPAFRNQLALTYLMANRLADLQSVAEDTLRYWPNNGLAQLYYGLALHKVENANELAVYYMRMGLESRASGTQEGFFYLTLGETLQRLGRQQEALEIYERGVDAKLFASAYQRSLYNMPDLRAQPFWTAQETGYEQQLLKIEQNWQAIRDEALALLSHSGLFVDEAENLRDTGNWRQFELYSRGQRRQPNCQKTPITCGIVALFDAAHSCRRGQIKFSVMQAGTHVWPHCGPTNCRLRAHLGLVVPEGTGLRVADQQRTWTEGKFMIFDDSFEHEVWHNGTGLRLVLIVDVWHPDLSAQQRRALSSI